MFKNENNIDKDNFAERIDIDKIDDLDKFVLENTNMTTFLEQKIKNVGFDDLHPTIQRRKFEEIPSQVISEKMVLNTDNANSKNPWFDTDE